MTIFGIIIVDRCYLVAVLEAAVPCRQIQRIFELYLGKID